MLGWLTHDDLKKEYLNAPIPHEYDPLHLPSITCEQIVWYDEMHIEQEGGANTNDGYQVRFHRDENGKYSPSSPRLAPNNMKTTFKYPEQARFCLGVCKVKLDNGSFGIEEVAERTKVITKMEAHSSKVLAKPKIWW